MFYVPDSLQGKLSAGDWAKQMVGKGDGKGGGSKDSAQASYKAESSGVCRDAAIEIATKAFSSSSGKKEEKKEEDIDLFGDDTEEDVKQKEEMKKKAESEKKKTKGPVVLRSAVIIDVKPWDDETDMKAMEEKVRSIEMEGLEWKASALKPIGYGIKKLQICCHVVDDLVSVDDIQEKIQEFEEYVQSTDIASFSKL